MDEVEAHGESGRVGLTDDAAHSVFGIQLGEVVTAEINVVNVAGEHVPHRGKYRMLDADNGFLLAQSVARRR